jgi:hypothetical protein
VNSLKHFLKTTEEFGEVSGLKMNISKTEATWLGSIRNNKISPLGISWTNEPIKCLGVWLGYDENKCNELNFEAWIQKCKKIINSWKQRNLTFFGKAIIIRSFIISQFLYTCGAMEMPDHYIKEIESVIFDYLWSGRKSKLYSVILT